MSAFILGVLVGALVTVIIVLMTMPSRKRYNRDNDYMILAEESKKTNAVHSAHAVHDATLQEVESALAGSEPVVVMVHSPHCGHCRAMMPNYEAAAAELKNAIKVHRIDARTAGQDFMKKHEVRGVPHIVAKTARGEIKKYTGNRQKDDLVQFMKSCT
jgi:thioredoxin-like negative regulator of GroEL